MRKALELMLWALMGAVVTFVLFSKPRVRTPPPVQPTRVKPFQHPRLGLTPACLPAAAVS